MPTTLRLANITRLAGGKSHSFVLVTEISFSKMWKLVDRGYRAWNKKATGYRAWNKKATISCEEKEKLGKIIWVTFLRNCFWQQYIYQACVLHMLTTFSWILVDNQSKEKLTNHLEVGQSTYVLWNVSFLSLISCFLNVSLLDTTPGNSETNLRSEQDS